MFSERSVNVHCYSCASLPFSTNMAALCATLYKVVCSWHSTLWKHMFPDRAIVYRIRLRNASDNIDGVHWRAWCARSFLTSEYEHNPSRQVVAFMWKTFPPSDHMAGGALRICHTRHSNGRRCLTTLRICYTRHSLVGCDQPRPSRNRSAVCVREKISAPTYP